MQELKDVVLFVLFLVAMFYCGLMFIGNRQEPAKAIRRIKICFSLIIIIWAVGVWSPILPGWAATFFIVGGPLASAIGFVAYSLHKRPTMVQRKR